MADFLGSAGDDDNADSAVHDAFVAAESHCVARVLGTWGRWIGPHARSLLGECVTLAVRAHDRVRRDGSADRQSSSASVGQSRCYLRIEAVGSGTVLVPRLAVSLDDTIHTLKVKVASRHPSGGAIGPRDLKLLAGHGGDPLKGTAAGSTAKTTTLRQCGVRTGDVIVVAVNDWKLRAAFTLMGCSNPSKASGALKSVDSWFVDTATASRTVSAKQLVEQFRSMRSHNEDFLIVGFLEAERLGVVAEFQSLLNPTCLLYTSDAADE